jgi:hypothetical protein
MPVNPKVNDKWYNIKRFMGEKTQENSVMGYSAAYPTRAERIAKGSSLPWGLTPLYLGYCHLNVLEGSVK